MKANSIGKKTFKVITKQKAVVAIIVMMVMMLFFDTNEESVDKADNGACRQRDHKGQPDGKSRIHDHDRQNAAQTQRSADGQVAAAADDRNGDAEGDLYAVDHAWRGAGHCHLAGQPP